MDLDPNSLVTAETNKKENNTTCSVPSPVQILSVWIA
jgi:hypothetical protein